MRKNCLILSIFLGVFILFLYVNGVFGGVTFGSCPSGLPSCNTGQVLTYTISKCEKNASGMCNTNTHAQNPHTCTVSQCHLGWNNETCTSIWPVNGVCSSTSQVAGSQHCCTTGEHPPPPPPPPGCTRTSCPGCNPPACPSGYSEVSKTVYDNKTCSSGNTCEFTSVRCSRTDNCGVHCGWNYRYCRKVTCTPRTCSAISNQSATCNATYGCSSHNHSNNCGGTITCYAACSEPTTSATPMSAGWTNQNINITINTGGSCGISRIQHCLTTWGSCTLGNNIDGVTSRNVTISNTGVWNLLHRARNNAAVGRAYGTTRVGGLYRVDKIPPTVAASNSNHNWFRDPRTATISASDTGGSGLAHIRYSWGSNFLNSNCNHSSGGGATTNGATLHAPMGDNTLYLCARDGAGNVSTWSGIYRWENIAPSVTFSPSWGNCTNQPVPVNLQFSDAGGSGFRHHRLAWTLSPSTPTSWSGWDTRTNVTTTQSSQGFWYLHAQALDNVLIPSPNILTTYTGLYRIDLTPPTVGATNSSHTWFDTQRTATVSASDTGGCGLEQVWYVWRDAGQASTLNSSCTGGSSGATRIYNTSSGWNPSNRTIAAPEGSTSAGKILYLCARDGAGNTTTWQGNYNWCAPDTPESPEEIRVRGIWGGWTRWNHLLSPPSNPPTRLPLLHHDAFANLFILPPLGGGQVASYLASCSTEVGYYYKTPNEEVWYEHPHHEHEFNSSDLNLLRTEGAEASVEGYYYTIAMSDTETRTGIEGHFVVNNVPEFDCPMIVLEGGNNHKGCVTNTHTGLNANNPLRFEINNVTDEDGIADIKGAVIWLSKDSTAIPRYQQVLDTSRHRTSNPDNIGVMMMKNGDSWNNPRLYILESSGGGFQWRSPHNNDLFIYGEDRDNQVATFSHASANIRPSGGIDFEMHIRFPEDREDNDFFAGQYDVNVLVFDESMLFESTLDHYSMIGKVGWKEQEDCGSWVIDLIRPEFRENDPVQTSVEGGLVNLDWKVDGTGTGIRDMVVNAYSTALEEDIRDVTIEHNAASPVIRPRRFVGDLPLEEIGELDDEDILHVELSPPPASYSNSVDVYLGDNEVGMLRFPITAFDEACNDASIYEVDVNLNSWVASKGGLVFSEDTVGRNADGKTILPDTLTSILERIRGSEIALGTELLSTRFGEIVELNREGLDALQVARARGVDMLPQRTGRFEEFKQALDRQLILNNYDYTQMILEGNTLEGSVSEYCGEGVNCYLYTNEAIVVQSGFTCDRNTLIMTQGDIHIEPDVTYGAGGDDTIQGCIFFAKGDVTIGAGELKSSQVSPFVIDRTAYDYIDGYIIANNRIDVELVDVGTDVRDGLEIHGGMIAFGRGVSSGESAIEVNRTLRAFNVHLPTVAVSWDARYAKLSQIFFGEVSGLYKREVGFKPH